MKQLVVKRQKFTQKVAITFLLIMLTEIISPTAVFALTGGPAAPEFSSFEPVTTTNMVSEFGGDFTYNIPVLNIPGANGGGYALSLSYHAGETVESEASWVGYGWTLNPGAINRSKKGFADDTKNTHTFYNDVPKNWTVSVGGMIGNFETYTFDVPVSVNASIRYNNYRGFGYTAGAGVSVRNGLVSLGYSVSDGSGSFSAQVNPGALLSGAKRSKDERAKIDEYRKEKDPQKKEGLLKSIKENYNKKILDSHNAKKNSAGAFKSAGLGALGQSLSSYGLYALSDQQKPSSVTSYSGLSFDLNFNGQVDPSIFELGFQFGAFGNYNQQVNAPATSRVGCGYLYSSDAYADDNAAMDYSVEKESMYNKRDRYLSIPFSAADGFAVSGEGLGGGFRLYSREPGHFRPGAANSITNIGQIGASVHFGLFLGAGFTVGYGQQTLKVGGRDWGIDAPSGSIGNNSPTGNQYRFKQKDSEDEAFFLRFNGDAGGDVSYGNNDQTIVSATLAAHSKTVGFKSFSPEIDVTSQPAALTSVTPLNNSTAISRSGRSSYIGYHTNREIFSSNTYNKAYQYEKSSTVVSGLTTSINRSNNPDQIGEIATVNEDGNTYVYGLPVNVKNETNLSYDLRGAAASDIQNNFLAKKNIASYNSKVGTVENGSYASSYLLTQITTPDYVDRGLDGPSPDDFGGYTKFEYEQVNATNNTPYHYRMPYAGLNYSKGEMSDPLDDMGSYTSGDKDVYYLKQIVTKTYKAIFHTSDRNDGVEAAPDVNAVASFNAKGTRKMKKLDYIELQTIDGKPIKKIVFQYDYSLCKGVLNNVNTPTGDATASGKLTLKALWFEYEGIVKAKISPYQFSYEYPKTVATSTAPVPTIYPAKYASFQTQEYAVLDGSNKPILNENPYYQPFAIDAWGNYQDASTGAQRFAQMKNAVNQTPPASFDPAAWQLKVIKLPSGGEIHVEYEQDEYLYVQNRRATALVSIAGGNPSTNAQTAQTFTLNVAEIGVTEIGDKQQLVAAINANLTGEKIYFKFLYSLLGNFAPDVTNCNSEYITGYVNFNSASLDGSNNVVINVGTGSGYDLPHDVCLDLVKKQKGGKINPIGDCNASTDGIQDGPNPKDIAMQLLSKIGTSFFAGSTACMQIKNELSYFKIPVLKAKKGGGLRVKRVLMYDKDGVDTGVPALYGTEYFYQTEDGKSSGVATNEPATIREENALVTFLPKRKEQSWASKIVAGNDREQFEGPIGETLLPSPSVGYSRVVAKNIHSGKTNTGFVVSTFYTVKDFPFDMQYNIKVGSTNVTVNGIDQTDMANEKDWLSIPAIVANYNVSNKWAAQGYRFILNDMHGKPKTVATYAGDYVGGSLLTYTPSSSTEYQYFTPGENITVMNPDGSLNTAANPGKEMEVAFEMKRVEDITNDGSIEYDAGIGIAIAIPIPGFSFLPTFSYNESKLRTHTTSKVIHYPTISKAVITTQDGITHTVTNTVFSAYTGKPLVTKTTDGYDGLSLGTSDPTHNGVYTSNTIPGYQQYKEMGPKAVSERLKIIPGTVPWQNIIIKYVNVGGGASPSLAFTATSGSVCNAMAALTRGDLIRLNSATVANAYFHVDEIAGNNMTILPAQLLGSSASSITNGTGISTIEIVQSGHTNQLNTPVGGYVTYGTPQTGSVTPPSTLDPNQVAFAADLTAAVNAKIANPNNPFVFTSSTGILPQIKDKNGVITTLDPKKLNVTINSDGTFTLKYRTGWADFTDNGTNQLVIDLNYYLDRVWNLDLSGIFSISDPQTLHGPHSDCTSGGGLGDPSCNINCFYSAIQITPTDLANLKANLFIEGVTPGNNNGILDKRYDYYDANGVLHHGYLGAKNGGANLITFTNSTNSNSALIPYFVVNRTDNNNGAWTYSSRTARLASNWVSIGDPNAISIPNNNTVCQNFMIERNSANGCTNCKTLGYENTFAEASYGLVTNLRGNVVCNEKDFASANERANNAQLFSFINSTQTYPLPDGTYTNPYHLKLGCFYIDSKGYLAYKNLTSATSNSAGCNATNFNQAIKLGQGPPVYCNFTPNYNVGGIFAIDPNSGNLVYKLPNNDCHPLPVGDCFQLYPLIFTAPTYTTITNVVSSSATTYDCNWGYDASIYGTAPASNVYENGTKGKWRPNSNYVFNAAIIGGSKTGTAERNYANAGTYTLNMFNWQNEGSNVSNKWVKTSTVTKYAPGGEAIEEVDALGIYSSAKFGYNSVVPYLVAQNSANSYVAFESFEKIYNSNTKFEDGVNAVQSQWVNSPSAPIAHSGVCSYSISGAQFFNFKPFTINAALKASGLSIKVWVKDPGRNTWAPVMGNTLITGGTGSNPLNGVALNFTFVARTGEWSLYETVIQGAGMNVDETWQVVLKSNSPNAIYIDDVRLQPMDAKVNAYVYDPATLRLLASFDDQHFGLYYQYNAEGKLVRKITETEKGLKTVTETQYNMPSVQR